LRCGGSALRLSSVTDRDRQVAIHSCREPGGACRHSGGDKSTVISLAAGASSMLAWVRVCSVRWLHDSEESGLLGAFSFFVALLCEMESSGTASVEQGWAYEWQLSVVTPSEMYFRPFTCKKRMP
jgi:hypothetical protein